MSASSTLAVLRALQEAAAAQRHSAGDSTVKHSACSWHRCSRPRWEQGLCLVRCTAPSEPVSSRAARFADSGSTLVVGQSRVDGLQWCCPVWPRTLVLNHAPLPVACPRCAVSPPAQVQEACSSWLSGVSTSCKSHGLGLLQQCPDAASLLETEAAVHTAIAEWVAAPVQASEQQDGAAAAVGSRPATAGSGADSAQEDAGRKARLHRLAPAVAAAAAGAGAGSPPGSPSKGGRARVSDWDVTCLAVVGSKVDLWQVRQS